MRTDRAVDAVVFDYGGVLTTPVRDSLVGWLAEERIDPVSFSRVLRSWLSRTAPEGTPIHRLETGDLGVADFGSLLARELVREGGGTVEPTGVVARMFARLRPDPEMFALAEELAAARVQVGLLSNSWGNPYPRRRLSALFYPVVISGEVGMRKPNADIFQHTLGLLGLPAARVAFLDDAQPNIDGAARVGMRALLHTDAASTRERLRRLLPVLGVAEGDGDSRQHRDNDVTADGASDDR